MKKYFRVMLGKGSAYAESSFAGGYIGADFKIQEDLTGKLPDEWRDFNKRFIPVYLEAHPDKGKISAGLACGALWTIGKGISTGDLILSPNGTGTYRVAEIVGDYQYAPGEPLPHRRPVRWLNERIDRSEMSESLRYSTGSIGTISNISNYGDEIERLLGRAIAQTEVAPLSWIGFN